MSQNFKGNDRGVSLYNKVKAHYADVIPLRGKRKAQNIRPMRNRNRAWERVVEDVRVVGGKEETWYGYSLYGTDVVMVSPTGIIEFDTGGWATPSTAQFIQDVGRHYMSYEFSGRKYKNKIWVTNSNGRYWYEYFDFPIFGKTAFQTGTVTSEDGRELHTLMPLYPIVETKQQVDRKKMKEAMTPYMPMVNYLNAMVKLTGGLLSYDMRDSLKDRDEDKTWHQDSIFKFSTGEEIRMYSPYKRGYAQDEAEMLLRIASEGNDEDWMKLLCVLANTFDRELVQVGSHMNTQQIGDQTINNEIRHYDMHMDIGKSKIRDLVARWVKISDIDVWKDKIVNHGL